MWSCTIPVTQIPPGSASASSRHRHPRRLSIHLGVVEYTALDTAAGVACDKPEQHRGAAGTL